MLCAIRVSAKIHGQAQRTVRQFRRCLASIDFLMTVVAACGVSQAWDARAVPTPYHADLPLFALERIGAPPRPLVLLLHGEARPSDSTQYRDAFGPFRARRPTQYL